MIKFLSVEMRNFLAYGNAPTHVRLERPGTTLIVGQDLDNQQDDVTGSNGVGKTTMLNAIVYALYDRPIDKLDKIDKLVNNVNKKNMEVKLEFIAENGKHYLIHRMRKMKSGAEGNKVHFYEDGKDITRVPNGDTNIDIAEKIGIPYDLFIRIVVFSATADGFLKQKGPEQKAFIEELVGLTRITEQAERLRKKIKETKIDFNSKQAKVDQLVKEHERHALLIENAKKRVENWKAQNAQTINDLFTKLEAVENVDLEGEALLHAKAGELRTLMQEQSNLIAETKRGLKAVNISLGKVAKELEHLRDSKCPYCMQQFADANAKVVELEKQELELCEEAQLLGDELTLLESAYDKTLLQYNDAHALITVKNLDSLVEIKNESKNIKRRIAELDVAANPFVEPLDELVNADLEPIDHTDLEKTKKLLEHQEFLLKLLTKNDSFVRKTLVSNILPFLNKQLRKHLTDLGLPHVVEFTESLEAKITKMGNELDFQLMSNGQCARIDFGLSVAFKDVRERLHGRTNIVFFDEVLDYGLDGVGVVACAHLLKKIARKEGLSLYVISHRDEVSNMFDKKLVVKMMNGFSCIDEEQTNA